MLPWAQNALPFPANMAPGGGLHQVAPAKGGGHMVAPKQTLTYTWRVPAHSGPGPGDFSAVAYTYRSTADITAHENAGLFGAIVIERPVRACGRIVTCYESAGGLQALSVMFLAIASPGIAAVQQQTQQVRPRCHQVSWPCILRWFMQNDAQATDVSVARQDGDAGAYAEVPLLFSMQDNIECSKMPILIPGNTGRRRRRARGGPAAVQHPG